MVSQLLRMQLLNRLELTYGQQMYNESNVMISGKVVKRTPIEIIIIVSLSLSLDSLFFESSLI